MVEERITINIRSMFVQNTVDKILEILENKKYEDDTIDDMKNMILCIHHYVRKVLHTSKYLRYEILFWVYSD